MKQIDFSQPGGFPLTQDTLDYMQQAYTEMFKGFADVALANGLASPVIISGIRAVMNVYQTGWLYHEGDLVFFQGPYDFSTPGTPPAGTVWGLVIAETAIALTFNDGSTPNVMKVVKLATVGYAADATTATFIPLHTIDSMPSFQEGLIEKDWSTVAIAGGPVSGNINYKKNYMANTVHLRGTLTITNTGLSTPPIYYALAPSLPTGYKPSATIPFTLYYRYHTSSLEDSTGLDYIRLINGEIDNTGGIAVAPIKSNAGNYAVNFDFIYSLD